MDNRLILIADDDPGCLYTLEMLLRYWGYAVILSTNGKEAVDMAVAHRPALIFMDLTMPQMDGCTATRTIQAQPSVAGTPVVALSTNNDLECRRKAFQSGMVDFISKPWKQPEIQRVLSKYVAKTLEAPDRMGPLRIVQSR